MKQTIVVRTDLDMGTGKLAAQVAHASLMAYEQASTGAQQEWKGSGQTKVVLKGESKEQLFELADQADREGLPHAIVRDAGRTQLDSGTVTALAVGPASAATVDAVTGELALY